jgi:hypothetical protein
MTGETTTTGAIHDLRERLLEARRSSDHDALPGLIDDVEALARRGYRCCLVDFDSFRPAYYVRVIGFEEARVEAELEFPIEPGLRSVQRLPLSHLVDYDEADPQNIRSIYQRLSPYLRQRRARLRPASPPRRHDSVDLPMRLLPKRAQPSSMLAWWAVGGLLFVSSLVVFVVA